MNADVHCVDFTTYALIPVFLVLVNKQIINMWQLWCDDWVYCTYITISSHINILFIFDYICTYVVNWTYIINSSHINILFIYKFMSTDIFMVVMLNTMWYKCSNSKISITTVIPTHTGIMLTLESMTARHVNQHLSAYKHPGVKVLINKH